MIGWTAATLLLIGCALFAGQRSLMYFPRRYPAAWLQAPPGSLRAIDFETPAGRQRAYYRPPRGQADAPLRRLWVVFGGNAMTALDWLETDLPAWDPNAGLLLIDYPGYGASEGRSSRASIIDAAVGAPAALARALGLPPEQPGWSLGLLGHSLGAAAALELAVRSDPERIVLLAPFTSVVAMGRRMVGPVADLLVRDRFDNRARLAELAARPHRPRVTIVHGERDSIVPASMGRALAAPHAAWVRFVAVPNADHNDLLEKAGPLIARAMNEQAEPEPSGDTAAPFN